VNLDVVSEARVESFKSHNTENDDFSVSATADASSDKPRDRSVAPKTIPYHQGSCDFEIAETLTRVLMDTGSAKSLIHIDFAQKLIEQNLAL
jgi:hypothetical protein